LFQEKHLIKKTKKVISSFFNFKTYQLIDKVKIMDVTPQDPIQYSEVSLGDSKEELFWESCPKCFSNYQPGLKECPKCGLVFSKWQRKLWGNDVDGNKRLEIAWQDVISRFEEPEVHARFIKQTMQEQMLPYAAYRYRRILEADPHNELAKKMRNQISEISQVAYGLRANRMPKNIRTKPLYLLFIIGAALFLAGIAMPPKFLYVGVPLALTGSFCFVSFYVLRLWAMRNL